MSSENTTARAEAAANTALAARAAQNAAASAKDKHNNGETNIQVVVRCRPQNMRELTDKESSVTRCDSLRREVSVQQVQGQQNSTKTFTFDKVFGPDSRQSDVYNDVVAPIVKEVLLGYSCTVFAYGQTGTGKTHTMEGSRMDECSSISDNPDAGIIPRTLDHLFQTLSAQENEFSVRVSQVELYNEEVRDLLSADDDNRKLKIFDDPKAKGCVIQGVEEVLVNNARDVIQIMQQGSNKRRVAATAMNPNSSRSHCVFCVTVHITPKGEDVLKIGKLNLVDLAGSENIGKSGAENKRAREAGSINQSLLTLGRVINALVEKAAHIPYRESKLTRLLQDSLGGRTKTCIIATISPSKGSLEETLSTLDYAYRAKNIRNRPEVNQCVTKKALIQQYATEIDRLKSDLMATQSKNGYYMSFEHHKEVEEQLRTQKQQLEDYILAIELKHEQLAQTERSFRLTTEELASVKKILGQTESQLVESKQQVAQIQTDLNATRKSLTNQKAITVEHARVGKELDGVATVLLGAVDTTVSDVSGLHQKLERKAIVESQNKAVLTDLQQTIESKTLALESNMASFGNQHSSLLHSLLTSASGFATQQKTALQDTKQQLDVLNGKMTDLTSQLSSQMHQISVDHSNGFGAITTASNDFVANVGQAQHHTSEEISQIIATMSLKLKSFETKINAFCEQITSTVTSLADATNGTLAANTQGVSDLRVHLQSHQQAHQAAVASNASIAKGVRDAVAIQRAAQREKMLAAMSAMMSSFEAEDKALLDGKNLEYQQLWAGSTVETEQFVLNATDKFAAIDGANASLQTIVEQAHQSIAGSSSNIQQQMVLSVGDSVTHFGKIESAQSQHEAQFKMLAKAFVPQQKSSVEAVKSGIEAGMYAVAGALSEETSGACSSISAASDNLQTSAASAIAFLNETEAQINLINQVESKFSSDTSVHLQLVRKDAGEYLQNKLAVDLSTGKTPKKKAYEYPRSWAHARSRDEILQDTDILNLANSLSDENSL